MRLLLRLCLSLLACACAASPPAPPPPSDPFVGAEVRSVRLTIDAADWARLRQEGRTPALVLSGCDDHSFRYTTVQAAVEIDGQSMVAVGVRKKGYLGSLSVGRPSLRIDFGEYDRAQTFRGGRYLTLNNSRQDASLTHTCMAYAAFARAGIPAPRCSFAHVQVNGENLGLYVDVEPLETPFLARQFGDDGGTLYEGTANADFRADLLDRFEQKTNSKSPDRGPLEAVAALLTQPLDEARVAALEEVVDLPAFLRFWAVESLISHWDGYTGDRNNFFVYAPAKSKRLVFIPWGTDAAFERDHAFLPEEGRPVTVLAAARLPRRLLEFAPTRARYYEAFRQVLAQVWDEARLNAQIDQIARLTKGAAVADALEAQRRFVRTRRAEIEAELAAGPPPWPFPESPAWSCTPAAVSLAAGTFSAAWGSIDGLRVDPRQDLGLSIEAPLVFSSRLSAAGPVNDQTGSGAAVRLAAVRADGSLVVVQIALGRPTIAPETIPLHGFETFGVVLTGRSSTSLTTYGFISDGAITFDAAGTSPGAPIVGHFVGKLVKASLSF